MKTSWLLALAIFVPTGALAQAQSPEPRPQAAPAPATAGFLVVQRAQASGRDAFDVSAYEPQPGDLILYDDNSKLYHAAFKLAGTSAPTHCAIVVARPDGSCGLLDITGSMLVTCKVAIVDVLPRLSTYPGDIMVRRLRQPLTPEQSQAMSAFAQAQVGKGLALGRVMLMATPFAPRSRHHPAASEFSTHSRWYCSEIVVAAGSQAQIFDPQIHHPSLLCPRDLTYDETINLSHLYFPPANWVSQWNYNPR